MHLLVAFWRIQTLPCHWDDWTIDRKIAGYRDKAIRVLCRMDSERRRLGWPNAKMIFLAPEHLFRCSSTRMAMPEADKKQVIAAVTRLSSNHPDALIVPGTVVWLSESVFASLFRRKFEARNSAFVFVNGSVVFEYNKHSDAGELLDVEKANAKFRAGKKLGAFECWGLNFGVEICYDHSNAVLFEQLQAQGKAGVDVHLILSSTVSNKPGKVAARSGGLLVHADGQDNRDSHTPQPGTTPAKTGIWEVTELDRPRGGGHLADPEFKRTNRGMFMDLQRRNSMTRAQPLAPAPVVFQGFDDDVSVYHVSAGP
jgi:hypothetical protein